MSSEPLPHPIVQTSAEAATLFANCAELIQLLMPDVRTLCFHDHTGRTLWITDGGDEDPAVRARVHRVVSGQATTGYHASTASYVSAIRASDGSVRGAIALVFGGEPLRSLPTSHERALAPLLEILGHAWPGAHGASTQTPPLRKPAPPVARAPLVGPAGRATAAPVVLRRTLGKAVTFTDCAFGALVATERPLIYLQRVSASESQSELQDIVEAMRGPMAQLVRSSTAPVVITRSDPLWVRSENYMFIACPVRDEADRLVAVLALFRAQHERNFDDSDCASLLEITSRIPAHALAELRPVGSESPTTPIARRPVDFVTATPPAVPGLSLEQRLRAALRQDGFDLHAQRIAPLRDVPQKERYEVLLRMCEEDSLQPAAAFFETAEAGGLLPDLDRWVISRLLSRLRAQGNEALGPQLEFAVNVTAASLARETFGDFIESQLFRTGISPQALLFEFSEGHALEQRDAFERLARRLEAMGCRIALDNCRQGLDIFAAIARLPVHRLKIDACLTHHIATDTRAAKTVRELVEVASDIGIETVGERVEEEPTREKLADLGVDFAQGFLLGQPRPLSELLAR